MSTAGREEQETAITAGRGRKPRDERLRPPERLHRAGEYRRIFQGGGRFRTQLLRFHYLPTEREFSRLGLVVNRRHGKAVRRNRIKRLLREVFRRGKDRLPGSFDVVLVPEVDRERDVSPEELHACFARFARFLRQRRRPGGTG